MCHEVTLLWLKFVLSRFKSKRVFKLTGKLLNFVFKCKHKSRLRQSRGNQIVKSNFTKVASVETLRSG